MIFYSGSRYQEYLEIMEGEIEKLERGDLGRLRSVYGVFATQDDQLIKRAGEAVRQQLSPMTDLQLLGLCRRFGFYTSLEWSINWEEVSTERIQKVLSGEACRYVLILGSFHPNGYYREKCVLAMAGYPGMLFWIFPRMNDWVEQVRDAADGVLDKFLTGCGAKELMESIPAFERLRAGRRRTEDRMQALEEQIEEKLSRVLQEIEPREISCMEPAVRMALYRTAVGSALWSLEEMEACQEREKESCLKRFLVRKIFSHPECTPERAAQYLWDTSAQVRRMAVEYRYERLKSGWPGLDRMLLDKSRGVREYVVYILEKHGGPDIREYYLGHLEDPRPENAILGLAEYSRRGNIRPLVNCLQRPERSILKCAILALGSQEDFSDEELLWGYLLEERIELSRAAFLSIRKKGFHFGAKRIYEAYRKAEYAHQRRYLLKLLLAESSWERLPFLLRLYRRDMPELEGDQILSGIRIRFMYAQVSEVLRRDILSALEECGGELPAGVEEGILYDLRFLARRPG